MPFYVVSCVCERLCEAAVGHEAAYVLAEVHMQKHIRHLESYGGDTSCLPLISVSRVQVFAK